MRTRPWNAHTLTLLAVSAVLTLSVGGLGVCLLLSGQPGTGILENRDHVTMMGGNNQADVLTDTAAHDQMMGAPADRGVLGGYTGAVSLVMIVAFVALIGLLLFAVIKERPGQRQPATCWNCARPVELEWELCPYCGARLDEVSRGATAVSENTRPNAA